MRGIKASAQARQRGPLPSPRVCSGLLHVAAAGNRSSVCKLGMDVSAAAALPRGWQTMPAGPFPLWAGSTCVVWAHRSPHLPHLQCWVLQVRRLLERHDVVAVPASGCRELARWGLQFSVFELRVWLHLSCLRCFLQTVFEGQNWACLGAWVEAVRAGLGFGLGWTKATRQVLCWSVQH